jgi:hypothetical protein
MLRTESSKKYVKHRSTNSKEMLVSWKNGSRKELKTGRKIKRLRKKEKEETWNSSINKRSNLTISL